MKKIIGAIMISIPFIVVFIGVAINGGLMGVGIVALSVLILGGLIIGGIELLDS